MIPQFIDVLGLIVSLVGATVLALGLIIPRKRAIKVGVSRIAEETDEENVKLPHVRDRIRESRHALAGLLLLIIGFVLQIIGSLANL